jgi:hypothetical protein
MLPKMPARTRAVESSVVSGFEMWATRRVLLVGRLYAAGTTMRRRT